MERPDPRGDPEEPPNRKDSYDENALRAGFPGRKDQRPLAQEEAPAACRGKNQKPYLRSRTNSSLDHEPIFGLPVLAEFSLDSPCKLPDSHAPVKIGSGTRARKGPSGQRS